MKQHFIYVHFLNSSFIFEFDTLEEFYLLYCHYNTTFDDSIFVNFYVNINAMNDIISFIECNNELNIKNFEHYIDIISYFNIKHNLYDNIEFNHLLYHNVDACEELIIEYFNCLHEYEYENFKYIDDSLEELTLQLAFIHNGFNLQIDYDDIKKNIDEETNALIIELCHSNEIYVYHDKFLNEKEYKLMYDKYKIKNWQILCCQEYNNEYELTNSDLILYEGCMHTLIIECYSWINYEDLKFVEDIEILSLWNIELNIECFKYFVNVQMLHLERCQEQLIRDEDLIYFQNIEYLHLNYNHCITDEGLEYLENIHALSLEFNVNITDQGLEHLENLEYLHLNSNENITNEGLEFLTNVEYLYLNSNENITNEGLIYLTNEKIVVCKNILYNINKKNELIIDECCDDIISMWNSFLFSK